MSIDPRDDANLNSRGIVGRINIGNHIKNNIEAEGFMVSEIFFLNFPIISLWKLMTLRVWPIWTPGALLAGFM